MKSELTRSEVEVSGKVKQCKSLISGMLTEGWGGDKKESQNRGENQTGSKHKVDKVSIERSRKQKTNPT